MVLSNFVVFEGIDGTGTSSQIRLLQEKFTSTGKQSDCIFTQEPTTNEIGKLIRSVLQASIKIRPETMARLFAADRCEHLYGENGIIEHLNAGKAVFSDRYLFSSLAYQTATGVAKLAKTENADFPLPELLFFFDLPVDISMDRVSNRTKILEIYEEESFQAKVRNEYLKIIANYEKNTPDMKIIRIDASQTIEEIHKKIWSFVEILPKI